MRQSKNRFILEPTHLSNLSFPRLALDSLDKRMLGMKGTQ
jgi:hypothetical protein